jgi:hypothetical protein
VAAGLARPAPASASPVEVEGQLSCTFGCIDSYEVKCTKASRFLCFTLEVEVQDADPDTIARYQMTGNGTAPAAMDNQDFSRVVENLPGKESRTTCMVRPGPEGTMRALVDVTPNLLLAGSPDYRFIAECAAGEIFGDEPIVSKKTTIVQRADE